jgi:hypothetical protein
VLRRLDEGAGEGASDVKMNERLLGFGLHKVMVSEFYKLIIRGQVRCWWSSGLG